MDRKGNNISSCKRKIRRRKTFSGCWRCRQRRVKCDEATPSCGQCRRYGTACPGYGQRLAWVAADGTATVYEPYRRRAIDAGSTWPDDYTAHTSSQVDSILALLDLEDVFEQFPGSLEVIAGPYSTIRFASVNKHTIPSQPSLEPDWDDGKSGLFYHYLIAIAPLMMPLEQPQNPWNTTYPLLARTHDNPFQECLLSAILSQAAANLAHLNCRPQEMLKLAHHYRARAMHMLRTSLESMAPDFVSFVAATLTLVMAETYLGMTGSWRIHLNAAWSFLSNESSKAPWQESESAWIVAQSLCLLKIRTDCMGAAGPLVPSTAPGDNSASGAEDRALINSIMARREFGFTTGLDRGIVDCLLQIKALASDPGMSLESQGVQHLIFYLDQRISENNVKIQLGSHISNYERIASYHSNVVLNGTLIYIYRIFTNYSPSHVQKYVSNVFDNVQGYQELGGRNLTVWPVFQAAVEACSSENQERARRWLADAIRLGIGNRRQLKEVVEGTWKCRQLAASVMDLELQDIVLDWRIPLSELDIDVLLV